MTDTNAPTNLRPPLGTLEELWEALDRLQAVVDKIDERNRLATTRIAGMR